MPLIGCVVIEAFHDIDEGFEYFEENVIRESIDCHPLKLAYATHT
jgi:hypothetical protein